MSVPPDVLAVGQCGSGAVKSAMQAGRKSTKMGPVARAFMPSVVSQPGASSVSSQPSGVQPAADAVPRTPVAKQAVVSQPALRQQSATRLSTKQPKSVSLLQSTSWSTRHQAPATTVPKRDPQPRVGIGVHHAPVESGSSKPVVDPALNPKASVFTPHQNPMQGVLHPASFSFHVKPLELPKFSGKASDYDRWKQHFRRIVDEDPLTTEAYKLAQLRECLFGGSANDIIDGILDGPGAYDAILSELDAWYGGDDRTLERQEREVLQWPRVKESDDGFSTFVLKLRTMLMNMEMCGVQPGRELYLAVTQKLPRSLLMRYMDRYDDAECNIYQLAEWLLARVHTMRRVEERLRTTETTSSSPTVVKPWSKPRHQSGHRSSERTFVASTNAGGSCPSCVKNHKLDSCPNFSQMDVTRSGSQIPRQLQQQQQRRHQGQRQRTVSTIRRLPPHSAPGASRPIVVQRQCLIVRSLS